MKHTRIPVCILSLIVLITAIGLPVLADGIVPFADDIFLSASVSLSTEKKATFTAKTLVSASSIKVTSCTLEKQVGSEWVYVKDLTPPSTEAKNTVSYSASVGYSSNIPSGGPYRVKAVFNADGHTVTKPSAGRTF